MTKAELIKIAAENNMEWIINPITQQKFGVWCKTQTGIPELDRLAESSDLQIVGVERTYCDYDNSITYRVKCPTDWMDLWGWA